MLHEWVSNPGPLALLSSTRPLVRKDEAILTRSVFFVAPALAGSSSWIGGAHPIALLTCRRVEALTWRSALCRVGVSGLAAALRQSLPV